MDLAGVELWENVLVGLEDTSAANALAVLTSQGKTTKHELMYLRRIVIVIQSPAPPGIFEGKSETPPGGANGGGEPSRAVRPSCRQTARS